MKASLVRLREQYHAVAIQTALSGMVKGMFDSFTFDSRGALVRNESTAGPTDPDASAVGSNGQILYAAERENLTRDPTSTVSPSGSRILGGPLDGARWTTDVLSIIPRRQARPQLASLGVDFLGAWLDQILGDEGVMAGSISRGGTASQETREIDTKNEGLHYDVAAGSTGYLLVWTQDSGLYARRFLPNGLAVDAERMVIRAAGVASRSEISAVWNGTRFFIAWAEGGEIVGAFLDPDGAVSPPQNLTTGNIASAPSRANPHLAWNGREFLLVWDAFSYCPGICGVGLQPSHAARLSADGRRLDDTSLVLSNRMSGQRVASNGRDFLVTSEEEGGAIARLVRSDGNGIAADPPIRLADYWALTDVARAGDGFVVAVRYGDRAMASWIGTVHIAAGGDVTSRMYVESGSGGIFERPAIAVNATGDVLIVESDVPPAVGSQRLRSYLESEMRPLPAIPAPPIVTSATIVPDGIRVSWRQPSGVVSGYVIEARRPGTSYFFPVALAPAEATSFFIAQYGADTVRIRAWNVAGLSEPSAEIGMTSPLRGRAIRH